MYNPHKANNADDFESDIDFTEIANIPKRNAFFVVVTNFEFALSITQVLPQYLRVLIDLFSYHFHKPIF